MVVEEPCVQVKLAILAIELSLVKTGVGTESGKIAISLLNPLKPPAALTVLTR